MKTIFVVDDDPEQAEVMAQALCGRSCVRAFSDPIRALAALTLRRCRPVDRRPVDAVDRRQGRGRLGAPKRPELPIFLVSGYPRGAEIAAEEGVRFFRKPIDFNSLREAVEEALQEEVRPTAG